MGNRRLLITGVNGLIGQIIVSRLAEVFDVCGLDIASSPSDSFIRRADITNEDQVRDVFDEFSPIDYVLHLAAVSHPGATWQSVLTNNIHGTWNVFSLANQCEVKRVVFASSGHATGYYEGFPATPYRPTRPPTVRASDPVHPDGPYGISKVAGEAIARFFYDHYHLEAVCLRVGTVLRDDNPTGRDDHLAMWLSHRDLEHLMLRALLADEVFPGFGIYYGVSRNDRRFWDISNAEAEIGFDPTDDASVRAGSGVLGLSSVWRGLRGVVRRALGTRRQ